VWRSAAWLIAVVGLTTARAARAEAPAPAESWATVRARDLTEQASTHRAAGRTELALKRYLEALEMDGTFGDAYLGLAALRESTGEIDEAERILLLALDRIPGFVTAQIARGDLLTRAKRFREATTILLAALPGAPDEAAVLERVVAVAPRAGLLPAALGAARRLAALARERGDTARAREAEITARALARLVGEADPVASGRAHVESARRALARAADPAGSNKPGAAARKSR
jgi:tetratricopeptide (TPR) repeat protein